MINPHTLHSISDNRQTNTDRQTDRETNRRIKPPLALLAAGGLITQQFRFEFFRHLLPK